MILLIQMTLDNSYWHAMMDLITSHQIILDRPKGTAHPSYPGLVYPLDYGYLEGTTAGDGDGIDVWLGSQEEKILTGILCTFDRLKHDAEIKLLLSCTVENIQTIRLFNTRMETFYIPNPMVEHDLSRGIS